MKAYLLILPIALLVAYSQIIVKWRTIAMKASSADSVGMVKQFSTFIVDPIILSAYASALLASFAWLFVVTKLPLTIAFPVYIGVTFVLVLAGGWAFLSEPLTTMRILAILLILTGIVLGING
jgi:multidrug transporter EmrE-like cation transporter